MTLMLSALLISCGGGDSSTSGGGSAPTAPSNLTATVISNAEVKLAWKDNSTNEDGFKIERSIDNIHFTQIDTVAKDVTSYRDTTVSIGTYYYRVKAYNSAGDSAYSNIVRVSVIAEPLNLTAIAISATQVDLAWTDNSTNEDGFKIERSSDNIHFTQIDTVAQNVKSYNDTGLSTGTYYYRVKAYNSAVDSGYSNVASATVIAGTPSTPQLPHLILEQLRSRILRLILPGLIILKMRTDSRLSVAPMVLILHRLLQLLKMQPLIAIPSCLAQELTTTG